MKTFKGMLMCKRIKFHFQKKVMTKIRKLNIIFNIIINIYEKKDLEHIKKCIRGFSFKINKDT
jgi:hypothetical protein